MRQLIVGQRDTETFLSLRNGSRAVLLSLCLGLAPYAGAPYAGLSVAQADGDNSQRVKIVAPSDNPADASLDDPRLPPVYPGEVVSDGEKKLKVWSTAGPVGVNPVPEAPHPPSPPEQVPPRPGVSAGDPLIGGVIVDRSKGRHRGEYRRGDSRGVDRAGKRSGSEKQK